MKTISYPEKDILSQHALSDAFQRERALDPRTSFIVQAPAGSGKTELLTQRFLVLLAHINHPEEILAITFTKKSAAEMRARIIKALKKAHTEPEPESEHAKKTWFLAKKVLERNHALDWQLLNNPNRLYIQTIDSFNSRLTKHLPILSHFGATPEIANDSTTLYREAVQEFLSHLEENVAWADAIAQLLSHMDNDLENVQELLINMLKKRDQWLPYITNNANHPALRAQLEAHLAEIRMEVTKRLNRIFPKEHLAELLALAHFAEKNISSGIHYQLPLKIQDWLGLSKFLFTKENEWRKSAKSFNKNNGFPSPSDAEDATEKAYLADMKKRMGNLVETLNQHHDLKFALEELILAPDSQYQETQWQTLQALHQILLVLVAQLKIIFQQHGKIDYIENAQAALTALGPDESPTDLALALDYKIHHILIDEFQDTSHSQYRLLEKLIAGWEHQDGRTLFVVGDPMQSIYRFREAEVGLFIRAHKSGIAQIKLEPLTLNVNFRSTENIVNWVNTHFQKAFPAENDIATGAVSFSASVAQHLEQKNSFVRTHAYLNAHKTAQAKAITHLIQQLKQENPGENIAILVRARSHLKEVIAALRSANMTYRAIEIDPLDERPVIQDLMALTRALLHLADRIAWLSVLRAPWCGLSLNDLLILAGEKSRLILWEQIQNPELLQQLSQDGRKRIERILPVLKNKIAERQRYRLRLWIESCWILLGGPACVAQSSDLADANAFFKLLDELDQGGDFAHFDSLEEKVSHLFAAPDNQADNSLQVMTIHNAKGLEFDTVILPGLEHKPPNDKKQLLLWMEQSSEQYHSALVLAPVHAVGDKEDSIYEYIKRQHAIKSDHETGRLLYVAATRAKKQLHLFCSLKKEDDQDFDLIKPIAHSLLEKIWPSLKNEIAFENSFEKNKLFIEKNREPVKIKRLTLAWENPVREYEPTVIYHQKNSGFQLPEHHLKLIGTLVHQVFQQICHLGINWWKNKTPEQTQTYIKNHLMQLGTLATDMPSAVNTVQKAIHNTLHNERGQWILHAHHEAQSEFPLTAIIDGKIQSLVIDRTFVDEKGTRWIIDYKTANFTGDNLEGFLAAEQAQYEEKMHQYLQAMQMMDSRTTRLGLYFPLIPAWREIMK